MSGSSDNPQTSFNKIVFKGGTAYCAGYDEKVYGWLECINRQGISEIHSFPLWELLWIAGDCNPRILQERVYFLQRVEGWVYWCFWNAPADSEKIVSEYADQIYELLQKNNVSRWIIVDVEIYKKSCSQCANLK